MNPTFSLAPGFSRVSAGRASGNRFNGFRVGLSYSRLGGLMLLSCLAAGCVAFPHTDLAAPRASGVVLDAQTSHPVGRAKVIRRAEAYDKTSQTLTNSRGEFRFGEAKTLRWLLMVCYAAAPISYQIEAPGYGSFKTNLHGGGSFHHEPHDLGWVGLVKSTP